jgi:methanethiol S-methyltransferase
MVSLAPSVHSRGTFGLVYAWSGFVMMWAVWMSLVIFLCEARRLLTAWPLPTINNAADDLQPWAAALVDLGLVALFGLQHSVMARPWFKSRIMSSVPPAFERCTYVHMANLALLTVIVFWQSLPVTVWDLRDSPAKAIVWVLFALGWITLFAGAWSFGIRELLGIEQMQAWVHRRPPAAPSLKTGLLYQWVRHPMYVGVLLGMWATPWMTLGHALLALAFTAYVLIGMRYEERDLARTFGTRYRRWRETAG